MRYLGIIPARGGSKGIPHKNRKPLCGKPLILYTIEAAQNSQLEQIIVSTDDPEIIEIAKSSGVSCIHRPQELAQDDTPTLPVLQHALSTLDPSFDAVVTLQPTSPLRNSKHINEAMALFELDPKTDSLVSIIDVPHNMTPESMMTLENGYLLPINTHSPLRRQDKPQYVARNGAAIYISKISCLDKYIWGGNILGYRMSKIDSIDIDDEQDWIIAECLLSNKVAT
ncbi:MAG: acylneuraminate cytidylyltransferase family protein [Candidatus Margulisbacteria bacterium]|nr:acylneuraminate cytidylyltransferase family protein [Candidatus Margulisiibacteriota bacterium]